MKYALIAAAMALASCSPHPINTPEPAPEVQDRRLSCYNEGKIIILEVHTTARWKPRPYRYLDQEKLDQGLVRAVYNTCTDGKWGIAQDEWLERDDQLIAGRLPENQDG